MTMKTFKEVIVTREEIKMINDFLEACEKFDMAECDILAFLEAIADEDEEYCGIDIVIRR